ncbi:hypothetical protein [Leptospirillum ferriphilum]|uniref:hypothetical protein n=1 Tax=Leptospirillum ferriphilum TaxID=178606 RepID=UPI00193AD249|nr:hypothetical protein [Leptospirillum ferriphilum]
MGIDSMVCQRKCQDPKTAFFSQNKGEDPHFFIKISHFSPDPLSKTFFPGFLEHRIKKEDTLEKTREREKPWLTTSRQPIQLDKSSRYLFRCPHANIMTGSESFSPRDITVPGE